MVRETATVNEQDCRQSYEKLITKRAYTDSAGVCRCGVWVCVHCAQCVQSNLDWITPTCICIYTGCSYSEKNTHKKTTKRTERQTIASFEHFHFNKIKYAIPRKCGCWSSVKSILSHFDCFWWSVDDYSGKD